jgi:hypothetical protein
MKPDSAPWGYDRYEYIGWHPMLLQSGLSRGRFKRGHRDDYSDLLIETASIIVEETIT